MELRIRGTLLLFMKQIIILLSALTFTFGCSGPAEPARTELVEKVEDVNKTVSELLKEALKSKGIILAGSDTLAAPTLVSNIYIQKDYMPIWSDKGELSAAGDTLFNMIANAGDYGLVPTDYYIAGIDSLLSFSRDQETGKYDAAKLYQADLLLTDAFFVMSVHLANGRLMPDTTLSSWSEAKADSNIVHLLSDALAKNTIRQTLESFEPKHADYHNLKLALMKLRREFTSSDGWDTLPPIEQDTALFYSLLKSRLIASNDYDSTVAGNDSVKLSAAIKSFQKKHALEADGKPGKNTRRLLNLTLTDHIRQIEINMERWRHEPGKFPERYVWVNIPSYRMKVMEADTIVMQSRIVAGDPKTPTPLLHSTINFFLIYPYWNVPHSIATKEMLPKIQRDTSYLRKNRFEVLDRNNNVVDPVAINWKKYTKNNLPYRFRQREGEDNSLGVIKFNFNNKHGVYLHDTNAKRFFGKDIRALSHGCMRLEKYMDFANYLIRDDSLRYRPDSLQVYLDKRDRKQINLRKPVKIYVKYYTCEADTLGNIMFYTDIYRKDEQIRKVLYRDVREMRNPALKTAIAQQ